MKVLLMAWTIYDSRLEQFADDCTGAGTVIKNICEYIGRQTESYLFVGKCRMPEMKLGHIHIVGTDTEPAVEGEGLTRTEKRLRTRTNAFRSALDTIKPDIVNIHGIGELALRCIGVCTEKNIPYVYTEHLFITRDKQFSQYDNSLELQERLYPMPGLNIVAVSSGMKHKIHRDFPSIPFDKIQVITNGTDFVPDIVQSDFSDKYGLNGKKVLLCVGTILDRKNQCQLVRMFQLLSLAIQDKLIILFCGHDCMNGTLQNCINVADLQDKMIYVGAVRSDDMKKYYSVADGLVMPSYAEGLSIAALEAISYGLPVIMFSDSECMQDLQDEKVICTAAERSDQCLAEAVVEWYEKEWDRQYIADYARRFSLERVAEEYMEYYQDVINEMGE